MRNYLFACLKSEARLALLAQGCDPTMGCLHADQRNRDSLALDAMEPVRADVDALGLSLAACSRIRAGAKVPHPRH
jgi:CRISPR/Cas system-associated endonuclease Cas1